MPDIYSQCMGGGVKESACNAGDLGLTPGSGRSPGEGHGNPLQYSCLENSMDRGAGGLQSMESQESDKTEQLNHHQWGERSNVHRTKCVVCCFITLSSVGKPDGKQVSRSMHNTVVSSDKYCGDNVGPLGIAVVGTANVISEDLF